MIVACGTGPSYWLCPILKYPKVGCSLINYDVIAYAYSEPTYHQYLNENVCTYAHPRVWQPWMIRWDITLDYGDNSGGLAVSVASLMTKDVGLIGFDGNGTTNHFKNGFKKLLGFWQSKGVRFYSLMPESFINKDVRCLKL